MTGAMYSAVAGLRAHMSALNVTGHNVANVNTLGYKSTRYTFNESIYTTNRNGSDGTATIGGVNPAQIGYGASLGTIDLDMTSKNYTATGYPLDCTIDGDGFFLVGNDKTNTDIADQPSAKGLMLTRLGNFDVKDGYLVDGEGSIVYGFLANGEDTEGNPTFLDNTHLTPLRVPMCTTKQDATTGSVTIDIDWPKDGMTDGTTGTERLPTNTLSIDKTGRITVTTPDEKVHVIGYLAIGKVDSPNGVTHVDGRYYQALGGAGDLRLTTIGGSIIGTSGTVPVESAGGTNLITGGLESSGTDLAVEITNMISLQRGYQANTRIITVTDSMLEELVNMKRG